MSRVMGLIGAGAALALLAGCGEVSGSAGGSAGGSAVSVVASTDVWGDVVAQIAGDLAPARVKITSIIDDPDADPHSYEADPHNQLALAKAAIVVENGGGYDDFVHTMLRAHHAAGVTVIDAVDVSGQAAPAGGALNEHVWYDVPTVQRVAARIEAALAAADPADAATFAANAAAFDTGLAGLERTEARIKQQYAGAGVAITEPVPLYLLQASGLVNRTPADFSEAIEEGTDVAPAVLKETEDLFAQHRVRLLAYNEQTSGAETQAVLKAAQQAGIPVVPVTETLPAGEDYLTWMGANLAAVEKALGA
jgi:zinc/manganese transport system substrate-binding protein